jgi:hypothetical protein
MLKAFEAFEGATTITILVVHILDDEHQSSIGTSRVVIGNEEVDIEENTPLQVKHNIHNTTKKETHFSHITHPRLTFGHMSLQFNLSINYIFKNPLTSLIITLTP